MQPADAVASHVLKACSPVPHRYFLSYIVYTLINASLVFFAVIVTLFIGPAAAGSGIGEVKVRVGAGCTAESMAENTAGCTAGCAAGCAAGRPVTFAQLKAALSVRIC